MRKKLDNSGGFLLSYFFNFLFNAQWGVIAFILWALHVWLNVPGFLWVCALAIWFIWPLFVTLGLNLVLMGSSAPQKKAENKNPYSKKNAELMGDANEKQDSSE